MAEAIVFKDLKYTYNPNSPYAVEALKGVSQIIPKGKTTAIIGHTGSGKSTLLRMFNVLLQPSSGEIIIDGQSVTKNSKPENLKFLRKKVGVVFQFPESQLFEETVLKDVMFGPLNFGSSPEEAETIARQALFAVNFPETLFDQSPFELSGGQKRRVAIAGVMAMEPEILVLDEPTAGLDPAGHREMMDYFMKSKEENKQTLILVTHQMEDVALYADNVIIMEKGSIIKSGQPEEVFSDRDWLIDHHLALPKAAEYYWQLLNELGLDPSGEILPLTLDDLTDKIIQLKEKLTKGGN